MKYITFAVPCYNSEDYLNRCVDSLLPGGEDVEIILINDGSTDGTAAIIDDYAEKYPDIVRAVHKENGGHGSGVNKGIDLATGIYFKVVDSDDWLDKEAYEKLLETIKKHVAAESEQPLPNLYITNYVYNHLDEGKAHRRVFYNLFPEESLCTWNDMAPAFPSQSMIMHALVYQTKLLRDCGVRLPEHTFFVDNILAYEPLPYAEHLYYINIDLYQYYIGRADQSVNVEMLIKRIDQYVRVIYNIIDHTDLNEVNERYPRLAHYLFNFLVLMVSTVSIHYVMSGTPESMEGRKQFWKGIQERNPELYEKILHTVVGRATHLSSRLGNKAVVSGYKLAKKYYKFQ